MNSFGINGLTVDGFPDTSYYQWELEAISPVLAAPGAFVLPRDDVGEKLCVPARNATTTVRAVPDTTYIKANKTC